MNATSFLLRELQKTHSPAESAEILDTISADKIGLVQHVLDNSLYGVAAKFRGEIIEKAIANHVPHDICPKKHFVFSVPVLKLALHFHRKVGVSPVVGKYTIAFTVVFTGAYMAVNPVHGVPHFVWDGIAYTIHGMGAAPIVESILRKFQKKN